MDTFDNRNLRILVFDDKDVDRLALCLALNQSGFAGVVHDTGSAPQALEQVETTTSTASTLADSTAHTLFVCQDCWRSMILAIADES